MMRIAVVGAGGLAAILARHIIQSAYPVIVLSRHVAVVDYDDAESLRFALQGIDLVISTIRGREQINLIHAARHVRVRLFVPAEFEGSISRRPSDDDPLDYGSSEAIELLKHCAGSKSRKMDYTVFSCGIPYERFAPGGFPDYDMGDRACIGNPGVYLVDVGDATADIVETDASGRSVQVCMTSVEDVGRFVAAAIELGLGSSRCAATGCQSGTYLPSAATSEEVTLFSHFAEWAQWQPLLMGGPVAFTLRTRKCSKLQSELAHYESRQNWTQWWNVQRLIATADGRYDFRQANLNEAVDFRPVGFRTWLASQWGR